MLSSLTPWWKLGAAAVVGIVAIACIVFLIGTWSWHRGTARAEEALRAASSSHGGSDRRVDWSRNSLPAPVARYFAFALGPDDRRIRRARIAWSGDFRTAIDARWNSFSATQRYSTDPPGFVWDAKVRMVPLLGVRVRDEYRNGRGSMQAKIGAVISVVDESGSPEINSGALLRYLAECVWTPTALLPSASVTWSAIDDTSALVSLSDAGVTVSLTVHFARSGEITRAEGMRHREVKGSFVLTPWVGQYSDYGKVDGLMIPMRGEVAWIVTEGRLTYWRGVVENAEFEFTP